MNISVAETPVNSHSGNLLFLFNNSRNNRYSNIEDPPPPKRVTFTEKWRDGDKIFSIKKKMYLIVQFSNFISGAYNRIKVF
jgi:hypothetical protein